MAARLKDTGGFALAIAVFALVLLAAIVAGGYFSATQEFQIGRSMRSLTASFYTGETAVREVIADWDPSVYASLAVGDTIRYGPTTLTGGGEYSVIVERVGAPADSVKRYFYIEARGRPGQGAQGERRQAAMVSAWFPDLCCDAAAKVFGVVTLSGAAGIRLDGVNQDPPGIWPAAACASAPGDSLPGGAFKLTPSGSTAPRIQGVPVDYYVDSGMSDTELFVFGDYDYNDLVSRADHTFSNGFIMTDSQPILDGSGACDRTSSLNWGAPDDPSHPCFDYFPVIHVTGDLELSGPGATQGILLIDNDLTVSGPHDFYGIAIVRDDFEISGGSEIRGGAIVGEVLSISGSPSTRLILSQCAVWRAERLSALSKPQLLSPRAWVELF